MKLKTAANFKKIPTTLRNYVTEQVNWEIGGWYNCIQDDCTDEIPKCSLEELVNSLYYDIANDRKEIKYSGAYNVRAYILTKIMSDGDIDELQKYEYGTGDAQALMDQFSEKIKRGDYCG